MGKINTGLVKQWGQSSSGLLDHSIEIYVIGGIVVLTFISSIIGLTFTVLGIILILLFYAATKFGWEI